MYTMGGAVSEGTGAFKGSVKAGKLADLVLVDADPTSVEPWQLQNIRAALTILGGNVVWERGRV
jgi:predicted amidohydrolase YtcJ